MRGRFTLICSIVLVLVAAAALAACGSSSTKATTASSSTAPSAAPSRPSGGAPEAPPSGSAAQGGAPGGGSSTAKYTATGAYTLSGGSATKTGAITAARSDESGVLVKSGALTLKNAKVVTSGASKSSDESSFYGLDAGVLASGSGKITMTGGSVTTSGGGANGIFAYGSSAAIAVSGTTVHASGQYAHGVMASGGGTITATNLNVSTSGGSSAPVATDRGGGTIIVKGGTYRSTGNNSPPIYSTGKITAAKATFTSTGSEAVVIEGSNSVTLSSDTLTTSKAGKWGVMIYQSMSGDAQGASGRYAQTGGSLTETAKDSPLFFVTNTSGVITLDGVKVSAASGVLVKAAAGQWGTSGSNGGAVVLRASAQQLTGDLIADKVSSIDVTLKNGSVLKSAVNANGAAKAVSLTLDASSSWKVTGDSHLTGLTGALISGSAITNIAGNGHTVTYAKSARANSYLGGKTYTLAGGGKLVAK